MLACVGTIGRTRALPVDRAQYRSRPDRRYGGDNFILGTDFSHPEFQRLPNATTDIADKPALSEEDKRKILAAPRADAQAAGRNSAATAPRRPLKNIHALAATYGESVTAPPDATETQAAPPGASA
jgi:hypothetical protein